jgi:hypothetical protein
LSTNPFEKYLWHGCVGLQIVTFPAHQKEIRRFVAPSKWSRNDMTSLERNLLPSIQYFIPTRIRRFDVIFGPVMKTARPAARLAPVNENAYFPEAIFPVPEYLSFRWQNVRVRHSRNSHSIINEDATAFWICSERQAAVMRRG